MSLSGLFGTAIGQDAQGEGGGEGGDPSRLPVKDKDLTAPPGAPSVGDRYIVASVATGVWAGHENDIAEWAGAAWTFETPVIGWITYVEDETEYYSWNGTAWVQESAGLHATTHENGGTDEVDVAGLSGELADPQPPKVHASSHEIGGADLVAPESIGAKDFTGFPSATPLADVALAMNAGNLEVSPVGASFDFWTGGLKYTKVGTDSVAIANDQALHYVYYDNTGTLQVSTSIWDFLADFALVATVYKDGAVYAITGEMHYYDRDRATHRWAHFTIGTRYGSGLTGTFGNTTFSIAQGSTFDEDLERDTGGSKADCALWYRNAGLTAMRTEAGIATPYKVAATVIQYDNAGTITPVDNNKFVNSYVYETGDVNYPIAILVGQAQHTNIINARNEAFPSILLSTAEWKLLYRATYKNVGGTPTYQEAVDFRFVSSGPAVDAGAVDHAGLIGREALNQHPASAVAPDVSSFGAILSAADDTVQKALDTLDNHAADHKDGGADEVATVTPASGAIPKADGTGKLPIGFMPGAVVGGLNYQGTWNAATNTPTLASGVGTKGYYYVVSTPGSTNLDGVTDWKANDWAVFNGTTWEKIDNTDQVTSVFTRTGAVVAASGDYTHAQTSGQTTDDHHAQQHALGGSDHTTATLAELNAKVSDATLDDSGDPRDPNAHAASHKDGGTDELNVEELASAGSAGEIATSDGAGAVRMMAHDPVKWFDAARLDSPDGTSDVPNSMNAAPIANDSIASNIPVREFPDDVEKGVLLESTVRIPPGSTVMKLHIAGHAKIAPTPSATTLVLKMYTRKHNNGAARGSWGAAVIATFSIPTNTYDVITFASKTLNAWGLLPDTNFQVCISRDPLDASDDLVGDFELRRIGLEIY